MSTLLTGHTESYGVAPTAAGTTARRRAFRSHDRSRRWRQSESIHFAGSRDGGGGGGGGGEYTEAIESDNGGIVLTHRWVVGLAMIYGVGGCG